MDKAGRAATAATASKRRRPLLAVFSLALACLPAAVSADPGSSGGNFIRIIQSPRAAAMGEAGAGLYGDLLGSLALNPAALARTGYKEVSLAHNSWLEGISEQGLAYAHPLTGAGVLAVSASSTKTGDIDAYDNSDTYAGTVDAGSLVAGLHYADKIAGSRRNRRFGLFAGGGVKYARETLATVTAETFLFDAGLLSISRLGRDGALGLGFSAQSLGRGYRFDSSRDPAPTVLRAGAGLITLVAGDPLSFALDIVRPNDEDAYLAAGAELMLKRVVVWRAGWRSGSGAGNGLRFGVGFLLKLVQLDYSLASYGDFGAVHRFGLSYKFGKPMEISPYLNLEQEQAAARLERAKRLMSENRFYESVLELNETLKLDPNLKEALDLMKKARLGMETERR